MLAQLPALKVAKVSKLFDMPAVDRLDLEVPAGTFYALLGPNGAGKTTLLRMVTGLLHPDQGQIEVFGHDVAQHPTEAKKIMAWVPDEPLVYDRLTPLEYLEFVAGLWQVPADTARVRAKDLLDLLGLNKQANQRCGSFSKGMLQKVALAGALIHEPRLIILDEPLTGLDAAAARLVKDVLLQRVRDGATVIMTTHILEVAERMAERIGVISAGRLIAEGSMSDLQALVATKATSNQSADPKNLEELFLALVAGAGAEN